MIHRDMNENETETNRDAFEKVIQQWTDSTCPAMMEDCGNEELDDGNKNDLND